MLAFVGILTLNARMENEKDTAPEVTKAIAVKGSSGDTGAPPKIIAKGEGLLAERLLDIAFAEGVKVRKDKDLTELLDAFDVESPVPLEALHAVSLILERVYKENQTMAGDQDDDTPVGAQKETTIDGVSRNISPDGAGK
ncbi:EscU/YscU/HrcU family type III secretion system export apparatus switch protein [Kordiimonas aquimaris]|uniref:EscU/YscU/HrcU family type III secretion system export apparatus switch protein n=1 Tax=Kordiimonas aquimaris TaxID=707591 RepID=UPI0021D0DFA3|nr:EscU/YscU/HrcU family type III secretion system export apparatus switch protein [Kordiimonas aquimaris]